VWGVATINHRSVPEYLYERLYGRNSISNIVRVFTSLEKTIQRKPRAFFLATFGAHDKENQPEYTPRSLDESFEALHYFRGFTDEVIEITILPMLVTKGPSIPINWEASVWKKEFLLSLLL
jgi:hypothetical protein